MAFFYFILYLCQEIDCKYNLSEQIAADDGLVASWTDGYNFYWNAG